MVVTTYSILISEYKNYSAAGSEVLTATKKKGKGKVTGSDSEDDATRKSEGGSDSEDSLFGKSLKSSKAKAAAAKKAPAKGKEKDKQCALFGVPYWRVVLGQCP